MESSFRRSIRERDLGATRSTVRDLCEENGLTVKEWSFLGHVCTLEIFWFGSEAEAKKFSDTYRLGAPKVRSRRDGGIVHIVCIGVISPRN